MGLPKIPAVWFSVTARMPPAERNTAVKREPHFRTWRITCQQLAQRSCALRPWEKRFITDLPGFHRISTKQRYVLAEIAARVLGDVP